MEMFLRSFVSHFTYKFKMYKPLWMLAWANGNDIKATFLMICDTIGFLIPKA
jgi:hypothetical protein